MAEFCFDCMRDVLHYPPEENDLRHDGPDPLLALCEGCGWNYFGPDGRRVPEPMDGQGGSLRKQDGPGRKWPKWIAWLLSVNNGHRKRPVR